MYKLYNIIMETKTETKPIPIRMTAELHHRLKVAAVVNSTTMEGMLKRALDAYDDEKKKSEDSEKLTK